MTDDESAVSDDPNSARERPAVATSSAIANPPALEIDRVVLGLAVAALILIVLGFFVPYLALGDPPQQIVPSLAYLGLSGVVPFVPPTLVVAVAVLLSIRDRTRPAGSVLIGLAAAWLLLQMVTEWIRVLQSLGSHPRLGLWMWTLAAAALVVATVVSLRARPLAVRRGGPSLTWAVAAGAVAVLWDAARWFPWVEWRFTAATAAGGSVLSIEDHGPFWHVSAARTAELIVVMTMLVVLGVAIALLSPPQLSGVGFIGLGVLYLSPSLGLVATVITVRRQQTGSTLGAGGVVDSTVLPAVWVAACCCVALIVMGVIRLARPLSDAQGLDVAA